MTTGEKIRKARKEAGLTQKQLGEKLGITQSAIAMFENNKTNIKHSTLQKIAAAFDMSAVDLWDDDLLRAIEQADKELDYKQTLMIIAEYFFSLLYDCETDAVDVEYAIDEEILVTRDGNVEFKFEEDIFFNFMNDVFSYFKFKLQCIKKDST